MRKNQKYSQDEMVLAMELWRESGLSQQKFCTREGIPFYIFKYWHKKLRNNNKPGSPEPLPFIPVQISRQVEQQVCKVILPSIRITYPNGAQIECPAGINPEQLRVLVNL